MTERYVGPGGSDAASGLTWALRKETLNGVEDTPVVAGDIVYVGPGTYREDFAIDVNGSSGNIILYIADVTGENTDGVGGEIRITGSGDDKTETRTTCIDFPGIRNYRTFRGFRVDMASVECIDLSSGGDDIIFEDCQIMASLNSQYGVSASPNSADAVTFRRCFFEAYSTSVLLDTTSTETSCGYLFENCIFVMNYGASGASYAIHANYAYGFTVKNCTFFHNGFDTPGAVYAQNVSTSNIIYIYNCLLYNSRLVSDNTGVITADYNFIVPQTTDALMFSNVTKGANSITRNPIIAPPFLFEGYFFPYTLLEFDANSPISLYACANSPPADDFFGITRPTTDSKKTRGAIQYSTVERETTIVPSGETESMKMPDAMTYQILIPITGKRMTFSLEVYRESDYAGTNPQMIIRQPGQSPRTETDAGAASQFNVLSDAYTPASAPAWIVLEIRSNNTAASGNYDAFWGAFEVR